MRFNASLWKDDYQQHMDDARFLEPLFIIAIAVFFLLSLLCLLCKCCKHTLNCCDCAPETTPEDCHILNNFSSRNRNELQLPLVSNSIIEPTTTVSALCGCNEERQSTQNARRLQIPTFEYRMLSISLNNIEQTRNEPDSGNSSTDIGGSMSRRNNVSLPSFDVPPPYLAVVSSDLLDEDAKFPIVATKKRAESPPPPYV